MIASVSREIVNSDSVPASACDSLSSKTPFKKKNIQDHRKERKALQKKLQYAHGKSIKAQEAATQLSHQVNILQAEKDDLLSRDKKTQQTLLEHEDAASKIRDTMKERTSRWIKCLSKKDEQILKIKLAADRRIEALEKKSLIKLSHEQSLRYRCERNHLKQVVALQSEVDDLKKVGARNLELVKDNCQKIVKEAE